LSIRHVLSQKEVMLMQHSIWKKKKNHYEIWKKKKKIITKFEKKRKKRKKPRQWSLE